MFVCSLCTKFGRCVFCDLVSRIMKIVCDVMIVVCRVGMAYEMNIVFVFVSFRMEICLKVLSARCYFVCMALEEASAK